jgi:predicted nucleotidyltransferase
MRLCERYGVAKLEVFGSAVTGAFDEATSDLDFLVEYLPLPPGKHADAYFGLLESLQALLQRPVDLVMVKAVRNPYFLQAIADSREVLYAA